MIATNKFWVTCALAIALFCINSTNADSDKIKKMIKSRGIVKIRIVEANVPDLDPYPTQGESDVFMKIIDNSTNETLCETQIIQDSDKPKHDFDCTSKQPLKGDSVLRIDVYDSDKPHKDADFIGSTRISLADVIFNQRLDSAESYPITSQKYPKHFVRAKLSYKPLDD